MRKFYLLSLLLCLAGFSWVNGQVITAFPYTQDFELFSNCGTGCGVACPLSAIWSNPTTGDDIDWTTNNGATSSSSTGPSVDQNPGTSTGKYLYMETSCNGTGYPSKVAHLVSPWFDFSSLPAPAVDFWYHMFGSTMGTMELELDTGGGAWLSGITTPWTDNRDEWQKRTVLLAAFSGLDSVRFRITGISGSSFASDMAVDDFKVYTVPPKDCGVISIDSLVSGCGLDTNEVVAIQIVNFGSDTLFSGTMIPVRYTSGGPTVMEMINLTSDFLPADTLSYTFTTGVNLSVPGTYTITAWTACPDDTVDNTNDTLMAQVLSIPILTNLPYQEDFEADQGGWDVDGLSSISWEWGTPNNSYITQGGPCGTKAWVTNLSGDYGNSEDSYMVSPCIDFSSLTSDPILRFDHIFQTESCCDEGWVEVSTDGGLSWRKLNSGAGINWYNDQGNLWWDGNSGPAGRWRTAQDTLTGTAGFSDVRIRFAFSSDGSVTDEGFGVDNILIFDTLADASPVALLGPVSDCGLTSSETIVGVFVNTGSTPISNFPVCYQLNNGPQVCQTVTQTLQPGDSVTVSFTTTVNLSQSAAYNIQLKSDLSNDGYACNDTANFVVENIVLVNSFPYLERFDNPPSGWAASGQNSSWALGRPAKDVIIGAFSEPNAWVTGGLGTTDYSPNEQSQLLGPCFDFTNLDSASWVAMKIWWNSEFSWDGGVLQASIDSGNTWVNIGNFGGIGFNWYTDNTINGNPGGQQEGWTGRNSSSNGSNGWVTARHPMPVSLVGQTYTLMRIAFGSDGSVQDDGIGIDNFAIGVPPNVDLGNDTTVCSGYFLATNIQGGNAYSWSTGSTTAATQLLNTGSTTRIDTIWVDVEDSLGLFGTDTIIISVLPGPFVDIPDTTICSSGTVTLDAGSGFSSYAWSSGASTQTISAAPGMYTVTLGHSLNACTYTDSVDVMAFPVVNLPDTAMFCKGDTLTLDAMIAGTYSWTNGASTQMIMVSQPGQYGVSLTDTNTCVSADTAMAMWFPSAALGVDTLLCDGASITLDAGVSGATYNWSTGDTTQTISVSTAGPINVNVMDVNGCMTSDTVVVSTENTPVASFGFATSGQGLTIDFMDMTTGNVTTYAWDFGDGNTSTIQNPTHSYGMDGSYTVTLVVTNACGTDTFTQSLLVVELLNGAQSGFVGVHPNPSNGNFTVTLDGIRAERVEVSILNLYGQRVLGRVLNNVTGLTEESFNMEGVSKGIYFIEFNFDGKSISRKLILE